MGRRRKNSKKSRIKSLEKIRFGIEIEVEFPEKKDSVKLIEQHRVTPGWEMDFESTLDNGAEYRPKDRNKLYFNEDSMVQIKEILALIKVHKGSIRPSCGVHCHVDMRLFSDKEIVNIIRAFVRDQDKIIREFYVLKNRLLDASKKIPKKAAKEITPEIVRSLREHRFVNNSNKYFQERFFLLNVTSLGRYGTLEFRLSNGTIQIRKIKHYIKWVIEYCIEHAKEEVK